MMFHIQSVQRFSSGMGPHELFLGIFLISHNLGQVVMTTKHTDVLKLLLLLARQ